MRIAGIQKTTLIDYPGKIAATIFTSGCNFRCPFCHNPELVSKTRSISLIPEAEIMDFLERRQDYLDAICFTGGEPLLHADIVDLLKKIKKMGYLIKIDTNGTNPEMLQKIIDKKLVDYIAMDIKTVLDWPHYKKAIGVDNQDLFAKVKQSIKIIMGLKNIDYEFRTTVVPKIVKIKEIEDIAKSIKGAKKYSLQQFSNSGKMIDSKFKKVRPYQKESLEEACELAKKYVKNCQLKNI